MSDLSDLIKRLEQYFRHYPTVAEAMEALKTLQRENDTLKHDIASHVAIASEEATRADGLEADALRYRELRRDKTLGLNAVWIAYGHPAACLSRWTEEKADQLIDEILQGNRPCGS